MYHYTYHLVCLFLDMIDEQKTYICLLSMLPVASHAVTSGTSDNHIACASVNDTQVCKPVCDLMQG